MTKAEQSISHVIADDERAAAPACRFSVIVPAYNRAALLPRCFDSLRGQTFGDFEVIVVDDGSTDPTPELVAEYVQREGRIRSLRQDNAGAATARNRGAETARGDYLLFLDSDDEAEPRWLETFAAAIAEHKYDVVCCGIEFVNADGRVTLTRLPESADEGHPRIQGLFLSGTFAVARRVFQTVGPYAAELAASQHSEWRFRLYQLCERHGWTMGTIPEPLVRAHNHAGPKIRRDDAGIFASARYVLERHGAFLMEHPRSYASWASAAATSAARTGQYGEARMWFRRAFAAYPRDLKNGARWLATLVPGLRGRIWSLSPEKAR